MTGDTDSTGKKTLARYHSRDAIEKMIHVLKKEKEERTLNLRWIFVGRHAVLDTLNGNSIRIVQGVPKCDADDKGPKNRNLCAISH